MEKQIVKVQLLPTIYATLPDDPAELSIRLSELSVKKLENERVRKDEIENELRDLTARTWKVAINEVEAKERKKYYAIIKEQTEKLTEEYHAIPVQRTLKHRMRLNEESKKEVKKELLKLIAWVVEHYNTTQTISGSQAGLLLGDIFAKHGDLRLEDVAICVYQNVGEKVFTVDPAMFLRWLEAYKKKLGNYRLNLYSNKIKAQTFTSERSSEAFEKKIRGENTAK